jgi:hypothetical protein
VPFVRELAVVVVRGRDGAPLLHAKAYYTVNEIPAK